MESDELNDTLAKISQNVEEINEKLSTIGDIKEILERVEQLLERYPQDSKDNDDKRPPIQRYKYTHDNWSKKTPAQPIKSAFTEYKRSTINNVAAAPPKVDKPIPNPTKSVSDKQSPVIKEEKKELPPVAQPPPIKETNEAQPKKSNFFDDVSDDSLQFDED